MQLLVVIILLSIAAGYVAWRLYCSLTTPSNPCDSCPGCDFKKKSEGKFCQSKEKY